MSDTKLLPCPFCGGKATLRKSEETHLYHVACFECGCRQDASYKKENAINAWNTRKPMERIVASLTDWRNNWLKSKDSYERGWTLASIDYVMNLVVKAGGRDDIT